MYVVTYLTDGLATLEAYSTHEDFQESLAAAEKLQGEMPSWYVRVMTPREATLLGL